ncbi:uncharacterized protein LOC127781630 [Oryza glaberrima]|uniref:uncharacterized protein LOC127781630 n=1 Tax=Oryza glaberrima TaxID=4538 RepID=UPI00224C4DCC|nr:uncharacterized protein LOC127781630 [Oryza glaberrima]
MASMKQEKDARIIVLALSAPVTKFKPPQTRKRNKASSSNHAKSKRASTDGPSGIIKLKESTTFAHGKDQIMEEATDFVHQIGTVNNIQQNQEEPAGLNQQQPAYLGLAHGGPQIPLEAAGITMLQESTTANGIAQIMEEETDTDDNVQQNKEEPAGLNQQQPDLGLADVPQIPEEAAPGPADPNEDVNDVFEFALNNNVLDL